MVFGPIWNICSIKFIMHVFDFWINIVESNNLQITAHWIKNDKDTWIRFPLNDFMFLFSVPGIIGCMQALEAIKIASGIQCILSPEWKLLFVVCYMYVSNKVVTLWYKKVKWKFCKEISPWGSVRFSFTRFVYLNYC